MTYYPVRHDTEDGKIGRRDKRYTITKEYDGNPSGERQWVLRFCDEYIGSYDMLVSAKIWAGLHNLKRLGHITQEQTK